MLDDQSSGINLHSLNSPSTKFNLFLKTRELGSLESILREVMVMPKNDRKAWVDQNGAWLQEAFDAFVQDSNLTLAEVALDEEAMELSKQLVVSLRTTMNMVNGILFENDTLLS